MGYQPKYPLFKTLSPTEAKVFKDGTARFCLNGFNIYEIETVHPIIRKEIIRIIKETLIEQGELEQSEL